MTTSIVWFTTDLRINDNETLARAVADSDVVIPVYCLDDETFTGRYMGMARMGGRRAQFILESLSSLHQHLQQLGSGLIVLRGNAAAAIAAITREYGASKVYTQQAVAPYEEQIQAQLVRLLIAEKATLITCATDTLFHTKDLPFTIGQLPDVFTHFRKQVEQRSRVRPIIPAPKRMTTPALPDFRIPALADLGFAVPVTDKRAVLHFKGCIDAAHERITHYFEQTHCIARYKETRNGLVGADYSSKFSPWLAQGCVSAREVYYRLQQYEAQFGANDSTYWLVFELLWRDYFHFAMQRYGHLFFRRIGIKKDAPPAPAHREKMLQAWMEGTTGVDFVDANMRELRLTGFMSNRGRQNVASYLINDLKIDWRYGAAWMEQQLIDYDVCSNWGNWCYLAGVGNDPRSNRYFNIAKQARDYDADGTYRRLWRQ